MYVTNGTTHVHCGGCFKKRLATKAEEATHPHRKMTPEAIAKEQAEIAKVLTWLKENKTE